jgi:hypothetical protein
MGKTLSLRLAQLEGAVGMVGFLRLLRQRVAQAEKVVGAGLMMALLFMAQAAMAAKAEMVVRAVVVLSSLLAVGMEGMEGMEGMVTLA